LTYLIETPSIYNGFRVKTLFEKCLSCSLSMNLHSYNLNLSGNNVGMSIVFKRFCMGERQSWPCLLSFLDISAHVSIVYLWI